MEKTITAGDMRFQVTQSLGGDGSDYAVTALVRALIDRFGLVDIDDIPSDDYWPMVRAHDVTAGN